MTIAESVELCVLLRRGGSHPTFIYSPNQARACGQVKRNRPDAAVEVENVFFSAQSRHFADPLVELLRCCWIGLRKDSGRIFEFVRSDALDQRVVAREGAEVFTPDYVSRFFVDVLENPGNEREPR